MHRALFATLCLFPCLAPSARAQVQERWLDIRNVSPTGHDEIRAVAVAPSGNVYATGRTGSQDLLLVKYGPNGAVLWTRTYDAGNGLDNGFAIALDPTTEAIHVVGRGDVQSTHALALDYDTAGNLLWSATYDVGPGTSQFSAARLKTNGNLVAIGSGQEGVIVVEYDPQGHQVWHAAIRGGDYGHDLAIDSADNVYVVGAFDESQSTTHFAVAKVSPSGELLWKRTVTGGGGGIEASLALLTDAASAVYVAGRINDATTGANGVVVKMDGAGNVLWTRTHRGTLANGGAYSESLRALAFAPNGNVRVAGETSNIGTESDVFAAEYTPAGFLVWEDSWNGPDGENDQILGMTTEPDGSMKVLATSEGASEVYDPAVLRWNVDGSLRWSAVQHLAPLTRFHLLVGTSGAGGTSVFGGMSPALVGVPSDTVIVDLRDQAVPYCFGDGSGAPCPCDNHAVHGEGQGCVNSAGAAARLTDAGQASLAHDTLALTSAGEVPGAMSALFQGRARTAPATFGDGLLCVGQNVLRLYVQAAQGGVVQVPSVGAPAISARSAVLGDPIAPGAARYYQMYYRDGVSIACPPPHGGAFNLSSGLAVVWEQ